jgi:hypothetical protein
MLFRMRIAIFWRSRRARRRRFRNSIAGTIPFVKNINV